MPWFTPEQRIDLDLQAGSSSGSGSAGQLGSERVPLSPEADGVSHSDGVSTTTPLSRSRDRNRRAVLTALSSFGARAIGIATVLISVPLVVGYLGADDYGLWIAVTSLVGVLSLSDLGLGNGLMQFVSEAKGRDNESDAQLYTSSAFYMLCAISAVLLLVFTLISQFLSWAGIFNASALQSADQADMAVAVLVVVTLLAMPVGLVTQVRLGLQEGFNNGLWQAVGSLASLAAILLAVHLRLSIPWLVLALVGPLAVASVVNGVTLLRKHRHLIPRPSLVSWPIASRVVKLGLVFFFLQVAFAVTVSTDNLLVARILGASRVAEYAIPAKLFMIVPMAIGFVLGPLWPAYREAFVRDDVAWARQTFKRSLLLSLLVGVGSVLALLVAGDALLQFWVGDAVAPPTSLMVALAAWALTSSVALAFAMFLNGANIIRFQAKLVAVQMVVSLVLSIALTRRFGIAGPAWGSTIAMTSCYIVPCAIYVRRFLRQLDADPVGVEVITQ